MRQIEKRMLENIKYLGNSQSWSNSNTIVSRSSDGIISIYLHGNLICQIDCNKDKLILSSCGWQTNTTKSRLNAIGNYFNFGIFQKNFEWFISKNGKTLDFFDGIELKAY